jgi:hypothetical protein
MGLRAFRIEVTAVEPDEIDGMVIARVTVTRVMQGDDIVDHVLAATADGDELGLAEALGMMRLAEDTLIRSRMGEDES